MSNRVNRAGLQVDRLLADFIETEALPGSDVTADDFWSGLSTLAHDFGPRNRALLETRETIQTQIDDWHIRHRNQPHDHQAYTAFLNEIGYLVPVGDDFEISTANTDPEIAAVPGPQLVVPITNARYALNAANARWGSLYDAFYGTDATDGVPPSGPYNKGRG
ncbi:MAG: malate synthase G, partial [Boseongicola sp.]|nr:malate synthase G [Boseongicola sp.]